MSLEQIIEAMFSTAGIVLVATIVLMVFKKTNVKKECGTLGNILKYGLFTLLFGGLSWGFIYYSSEILVMMQKFKDLISIAGEKRLLKVYDNPDDFLNHLGFPVVGYLVFYIITFAVVVSLLYISVHKLVVNIIELYKRLTDKAYGKLKFALEMNREIYDLPKSRLVKAFLEFKKSNSKKPIYYEDSEDISLALFECGYDIEAKTLLNSAIKQKETLIMNKHKLSYFDVKERLLFSIKRRKGFKIRAN